MADSSPRSDTSPRSVTATPQAGPPPALGAPKGPSLVSRWNQKGHSKRVTSIAIAPDGAWVASGSEDATIRFWGGLRGESLHTSMVPGVKGMSIEVLALGTAPDGSWLASGSFGADVHFWDPVSGKDLGHLLALNSISWASVLVVSPDGSWVAVDHSSARSRTIRIWDTKRREVRMDLPGHRQSITALACTSNGAVLASAGSDNSVRLWDLASGKLIRTIHVKEGVKGLAVSPDDKWIVTVTSTAVRQWDLDSGRELRRIPASGAPACVDVSPDGAWIASAGLNGLALIDSHTGTQAHYQKLSSFGNAIRVSADGRWLAVGCEDGSVQTWDFAH